MTIRRLRPPLGDYAQHVDAWSFIKDELLRGDLADSLLAEFFVGEIDGAVVARPRTTRPPIRATWGLWNSFRPPSRSEAKAWAAL